MKRKVVVSFAILILFVGILEAEDKIQMPAGFILVEAGTFTMGSAASESMRDNDEIRHQVEISMDFCISKYEVTQAEYRSIMGNNPSHNKGDNLPVEKVSWYDAVDYCNRLSEKEGLTPCYSGSGTGIRCDFSADGYRLPTEAEWEYAARGGKKSRGYAFSGSDSIGEVGWYLGNSGNKTHPVGQKQANELGVFDMTGNVSEWCWDWYGGYPDDEGVTDPSGSLFGLFRVERGGGWYGGEKYCRSANRNRSDPTSVSSGLGFRVVCQPSTDKRFYVFLAENDIN